MEDADWNTAKLKNTTADYNIYLLKYPKNTHTAEAKEAMESLRYRALTKDDGLSCKFTQDLTMTMSSPLAGGVSSTTDHFKCTDKTKAQVEIELVSTGLENGKVAIRTKKFGTVYRGNDPNTFGTYEMTGTQISQLKSFLAFGF